MNRKLTAVMLSCCLLFTFASTANAGLEILTKTYGNAQTVTADFVQTLIHKDSGGKEVRTGNFVIKRPELVRWVTSKPFNELLIVNKDAVWNYLEDEEVVYKYPRDVAEESQNALSFLLGDAKVDNNFYVEDGETKGKYLLFPKEPTANLTEAELWLDESSGIITRLRIIDFYGNVNDITFKNVQFNKSINNLVFNFTPPNGVEVEDNTKK
ncbi:outer membrane lipoprotein chaperone LolA [Halodesulfovibrio marinisediminis]|uniref:Outer-membrane lipoprotein carrier protein n=1 Tax=Halodesulfovibrio marinisediminis DSM 17456 TaxID=1121457 RepID=A0A1N6E6E3_9BACT|nr:outer membrane lipoprotein chaperone LolA [Halodesulfovibrio marinisediminis]SIN78561.1 outer membrane lipoprotein carrier protein [Halodesulfovibrio marinisediminis DSM 17456]